MHSALIQLIRDALADGANDVFLVEDEPPRVRRDGEVVVLHPGPVTREALDGFWRTCGVDPAARHETDVSWRMPEGARLRVNLYHTLGRLAAVMRPIRSAVPALEDLGLPVELLQSWMLRQQGLVLVTGPTGAGKSTTVAACLDWLNHNLRRHIVTLEDPIEYLFSNDLSLFSQREIHQDSDEFASALRATLRQSPDVIFLGEIRDEETALTALHAAATGHLVISTLHSSSIIETLDRFSHLIGSGAAGAVNLLASQLIGVLSQKLLPRIGGGLFPALEYMQNQAATRRWIIDGKLPEIQDHIIRSRDGANCSMVDYLVHAVIQGFVDAEVARAACPRPQDFDRALRGIT